LKIQYKITIISPHEFIAIRLEDFEIDYKAIFRNTDFDTAIKLINSEIDYKTQPPIKHIVTHRAEFHTSFNEKGVKSPDKFNPSNIKRGYSTMRDDSIRDLVLYKEKDVRLNEIENFD